MNSSKQETLLLLSKILNEFQWLLNAYNVDYFTNAHWANLPKIWQNCLEKLDQNDIPLLLCPSSHTKYVFPLGLLCLRSISFRIRASRTMINDQDLIIKTTGNEKSLMSLSFSNEHELPVKPLTNSDHILCRKVKLKKRHEIERLCKIIPPLMKIANNCTKIVNCGSGQGHLDRILTFCYGYKVYSIEANCEHINNASAHDDKVLNALRKYKLTDMVAEDMPTKVNCFLTKNDEIGDHTTTLEGKHLLLGLHACGPLSNLILEQFVANPDASCLVCVCCCYMKSGLERFPMSTFLQQHILFKLTTEAKELACHAIEKFLTKFDKKELDSLKVHGYRACLEMLIQLHNPSKRHTYMRSVKIDSSMTFKEYALKATQNLNLGIPEEVLQSELVESYIGQIDQVVIFYSLRLLVAPLVEMFILLDYQQFVEEHCGVKRTFLVPLFEPSISPRNLILVAHK